MAGRLNSRTFGYEFTRSILPGSPPKVGEGLLSVQNVINKLRGLDPSHAQPQKEVFQVTPSKQGRLILSADGVDGIAVSCSDAKGLSAEETAARSAMEYVDQARDPSKPCSKCVQWVAAASDGCGGCKVLKGPIHPNGGCKLFASRG